MSSPKLTSEALYADARHVLTECPFNAETVRLIVDLMTLALNLRNIETHERLHEAQIMAGQNLIPTH